MANTDISLINDGGVFVPSAPSVPVVSGDTVSFSTSGGEAAFLFFSPDASNILSPRPASAAPVPASGKAVFSFTSSQPGAYSAYFGANEGCNPKRFPELISRVLLLEVQSSGDDSPPFTATGDTVKTGS